MATFGGNANYFVAYSANIVEIKVSLYILKITSTCIISKIQLFEVDIEFFRVN